MVLILDGNSKHAAQAWRKIGTFWIKFKFVTALNLTKWFEQVKYPRIFYTYVPISELPSNIHKLSFRFLLNLFLILRYTVNAETCFIVEIIITYTGICYFCVFWKKNIYWLNCTLNVCHRIEKKDNFLEMISNWPLWRQRIKTPFFCPETLFLITVV